MLERTKAQSPFYNADHEAFRDVMRRFVAHEIEPYAHEWKEAGEASQELARAGAGGVSSSLMSHTIGSPPIARAARPEIKSTGTARGTVGRENLGARDHRTEWRVRRRQSPHQSAPRR
jgi:Acyl-CoA dehydrogenase, N-terminal domain